MSVIRHDATTRIEIRDRSRLARTLGAVVQHAGLAHAVRKDDLQFGDRVIVRTRNSIYSLWSLGGDEFAVSGGWFDRNGPSPRKVTVNGCTYGGSMIRFDVVAAPGLFLEFGNSVATTRIKEVRVERGSSPDLPC